MARGKASSEAAAKRGRGRPSGARNQKRAGSAQPHADHLASVVNPQLMVSVEEARAMLGGVGKKGLYQLIHRGEIESRKVGARRLIPVWSLEKYVGLPASA